MGRVVSQCAEAVQRADIWESKAILFEKKLSDSQAEVSHLRVQIIERNAAHAKLKDASSSLRVLNSKLESDLAALQKKYAELDEEVAEKEMRTRILTLEQLVAGELTAESARLELDAYNSAL